jgi:hypothetical protein
MKRALYPPSADSFVGLSPFKKKSLEFQLQELQAFNLMPYKVLCSEVNKMRLIRRYYMLCSFLHSFQAKYINSSNSLGWGRDTSPADCSWNSAAPQRRRREQHDEQGGHSGEKRPGSIAVINLDLYRLSHIYKRDGPAGGSDAEAFNAREAKVSCLTETPCLAC